MKNKIDRSKLGRISFLTIMELKQIGLRIFLNKILDVHFMLGILILKMYLKLVKFI